MQKAGLGLSCAEQRTYSKQVWGSCKKGRSVWKQKQMDIFALCSGRSWELALGWEHLRGHDFKSPSHLKILTLDIEIQQCRISCFVLASICFKKWLCIFVFKLQIIIIWKVKYIVIIGGRVIAICREGSQSQRSIFKDYVQQLFMQPVSQLHSVSLTKSLN